MNFIEKMRHTDESEYSFCQWLLYVGAYVVEVMCVASWIVVMVAWNNSGNILWFLLSLVIACVATIDLAMLLYTAEVDA